MADEFKNSLAFMASIFNLQPVHFIYTSAFYLNQYILSTPVHYI